MIIGIHGIKRSGKDTVAQYLMKKNAGLVQIAFADAIKESLSAAFNTDNTLPELTGLKICLDDFYEGGRYDRDNHDLGISNAAAHLWLKTALAVLKVNYPDIPTNVPDNLKIAPRKVWTIRILMQILGTDIVTKYHPDYWVKITIRDIEAITKNGHNGVIVSDVRFANEAQALRDIHAKMIFLERDTGNRDHHLSEQGLTPTNRDVLIINNGTLEDLYKKVDRIL